MKSDALVDGPDSSEFRENIECVCDGGQDCNPDRGKPRKRLTTALLQFVGFTKGVSSTDAVMAFQFDPLVHRMVDKHGWDEAEAQICFMDLKRYLWLAATTGKPLVPSPKIDDMWHNFVLFTMDYEEFCLTHLGSFIHHRPRRRDDAPSGHSSPVGMTLKLATQHFGQISKNWDFPGVELKKDCATCSNRCQCS